MSNPGLKREVERSVMRPFTKANIFPAPARGGSLLCIIVGVTLVFLVSSIAFARFQWGETRSKLAEARADMRALAMALENYRVDHGVYAPTVLSTSSSPFDVRERLSAPYPYLNKPISDDPFPRYQRLVNNPTLSFYPYAYFNYGIVEEGARDWAWRSINYHNVAETDHKAFMIWSAGPDQNDNALYWGDWMPGTVYYSSVYDPSNGTLSSGDLAFLGGEIMNKGLPVDK
jgi:hypothetical protein